MANSIGGVQAAHPYDIEHMRQLAVDLEKEVQKFQENVQTILKAEGKEKDSEPFSLPIPSSKPGEGFIEISRFLSNKI